VYQYKMVDISDLIDADTSCVSFDCKSLVGLGTIRADSFDSCVIT
jgi:hypothetical protein